MFKLLEHANQEKLVLFIGAGVSMVPPSSLPSWYQLNDMTISALGRRVGEYIESVDFVNGLVQRLIDRRDHTDTFAPDYQAQLMVEETGDEYFRVFDALDGGPVNACHEAVAALAAAGKVGTVLTTNFDRLCEIALADRGVQHRVYSDAGGFAVLRASVVDGSHPDVVSVVKIHGTVRTPGSVVDTLRQRLQGRGEDLQAVLDHLLQHHHWLFAGFSGADFDYDPDYLGIRKSVQGGRGFTFLARSGAEPRPSVVRLVEAYGDRARIVRGELPDWLVELADVGGVNRGGADRGSTERHSVEEGIDQWVASLENMQATILLTALLAGAGATLDSYGVLRRAWRHFRTQEDIEGSNYGRFCLQFGKRLLHHGVTPDENWEGAPRSELTVGSGPFPRDDAFQFLARAKKNYGNNDATPYLALALAYRGNLSQAETAMGESLKLAADSSSNALWADGVHAAGILRYLQRDWRSGAQILTLSFPVVRWDGDEPRRARYSNWLGAYLAWNGRYEEAEKLILESRTIARGLALTATLGESAWALGVLETEKRNAKASLRHFDEAWEVFDGNELRPHQILTYLEAARSITIPTDDPQFNQWAVDRFLLMLKRVDDLLEHEHLYGFLPSFCLASFYVFWNMYAGSTDEQDAIKNLTSAARYLQDARRFAADQQNERLLATVKQEEPDVAKALQQLAVDPSAQP